MASTIRPSATISAFYVFTLPLLEDWRDLFMLILFLTAVVTGMVYLGARRAGFPRLAAARISRGAAAHFSVLLAFFFVQRAMNYWLGALRAAAA